MKKFKELSLEEFRSVVENSRWDSSLIQQLTELIEADVYFWIYEKMNFVKKSVNYQAGVHCECYMYIKPGHHNDFLANVSEYTKLFGASQREEKLMQECFETDDEQYEQKVEELCQAFFEDEILAEIRAGEENLKKAFDGFTANLDDYLETLQMNMGECLWDEENRRYSEIKWISV